MQWRHLTIAMFYSSSRNTQEEEIAFMQTAHFSALEAKHAGLDRKIAAESQRPLPDPVVLAALKKQKLRVKEEMVIL